MTPDVNVLVAAARSDHPHHDVARDWLGEAVTGTMKLGDGTVVPISEGKIEGSRISFRFRGLNARTLVAKGLLKGDVIDFELLLPGNEFGSPYTARRK